MTKSSRLAEAQARTIEVLALEHRRQCDGRECALSLSILMPVVESLRGKPLDDNTRKVFL